MVPAEEVNGLWDWAFKGAIAIIATGFGWTMNGMKTDIKQVQLESQKTSKELSDYKAHVADYYPNQRTMERLYSTLEKMDDKINVLIAKKSH